MPSTALHVGTGVHLGLAEMARGNDWRGAVADWSNQALDEFSESYVTRVGCTPSNEELLPYLESARLIYILLVRYESRYRTALFGTPRLRPLYIEQAFKVQIPGRDDYLVGTWDNVLEDEETKALWIVEHKTFTKKPNFIDLQMSPQFSAYVWAARQVFPDRIIAGVLYDGIAKKVPTGPELLKSGKLSRAFNETTDYMTYVDAINFYDFDFLEYADILERFKERDDGPDNPYWTRYQIQFTDAQIQNTADMIAAVFQEMAAPLIYPTFRMEGCFDCHMQDLCHATQNGEDVLWLTSNLYVKNEGSASFKAGREEIEYVVIAA